MCRYKIICNSTISNELLSIMKMTYQFEIVALSKAMIIFYIDGHK